MSKPTKSRQVMIVLEVFEELNPELVFAPLAEVAKAFANVDVTAEFAGDEYYFNEHQMTHLVVRDLEDGDEKDIVAWKFDLTEPEEEEEETAALDFPTKRGRNGA